MPVNTAPPVMNGIPIGQVTVPPDAISLASTADTRERSNSVHSAHSAGTRATRPESLAQSGKSNVSPAVPGSSLFPVDKRSTKSKMSKKKRRGLSGSSGVSGAGSTIAAALAKTGLHIASPTEGDLYGKRYIGKTRSPHLVRGGADGEGEGEYEMEEDDEEDEDASDSDPEEHLPVTGFAVASNKRQADFHALFTSVDEGDYLIEGELVIIQQG